MRIGVGRCVPVGDLVIDRGRGRVVDVVERRPVVADCDRHRPYAAARVTARDAIALVRGGLRRRGVHRQRRGRHRRPETDIGQPGAPVDADAHHHMAARRGRRGRVAQPAHAAEQALGLETDRAQHAQEQAVLLEAIAAAPALDQLRGHRFGADVDVALDQRVDRFERDRRDMRGVQRAQHRQRRLDRPVVADAGEIARQQFAARRRARGGGAVGGFECRAVQHGRSPSRESSAPLMQAQPRLRSSDKGAGRKTAAAGTSGRSRVSIRQKVRRPAAHLQRNVP